MRPDRTTPTLSHNTTSEKASDVTVPESTATGVTTATAAKKQDHAWWRLLLKDKLATASAIVLCVVVVTGIIGPWLAEEAATDLDLSATSRGPSLSHGLPGLLGTDSLGRSVLARVVVATQTSLSVAVPAVLISLTIGAALGMWAGYRRGWRETLAMRVADVILSFPSLLLAVVVLYVFDPSIANIVAVLAIARVPVYLRTAKAETAEVRSRLFVDAARTFGAAPRAIVLRHVLPIILPTLLTVATLDFCFVMLTESSLSFLGIGIQPPEISWGLLVSQGRDYLSEAWWISFFPGLAIVLTTGSATVLAAWVRIALDPAQRWRLMLPRTERTPDAAEMESHR